MSKIVMYDENGNEVYFDYGVDAREAVMSGRFFETPPEGTEKAPVVVEPVKKKGRPAKSEVALDAEDATIAETVLEDVINEEAVDAKE
ncbi:MAG: hypothetical protein WCY62_09880 [Clostridia bacterium]|jgi:hypothetical protein